jgi:hypothetical protein
MVRPLCVYKWNGNPKKAGTWLEGVQSPVDDRKRRNISHLYVFVDVSSAMPALRRRAAVPTQWPSAAERTLPELRHDFLGQA